MKNTQYNTLVRNHNKLYHNTQSYFPKQNVATVALSGNWMDVSFPGAMHFAIRWQLTQPNLPVSFWLLRISVFGVLDETSERRKMMMVAMKILMPKS